ncbi:hypothetical protein AXX17_AT4G30680 [Arabidopsis thaliana]|uniref:Uncharacterized protein n=1 Tax=Arabidopsis thaliana TaxID=3702 RepID=A0A178UVZ3_ARATH|nr:hypothetical protein AXX17_AT4G30680 [Arabidopsis thaliana]
MEDKLDVLIMGELKLELVELRHYFPSSPLFDSITKLSESDSVQRPSNLDTRLRGPTRPNTGF